MKKYTLIAIIFKSSLIFAQPVLNASDYNPSNSISNYTANPTAFSAGLAGANRTWNYSNIALTLENTSTSIIVTTAPFSSNFPNANLYVKNTSSNNDIFAIYNSTSSKLEVLGISNNSIEIVNFSSNPQTVYQFPLTFETVINDTYSTSNDPNANNPFTVTYDAYGTLITPFGTYNNVIRTKKIDGLNPDYTWFTPNPYQIIMTASFGSSGATSVRFFEPNNLSTIQNQLTQKLKIYPNPTLGNFTIKDIDFSNNENFLNVYDVLGNKIINKQKIDSDSENIDFSNVASGLYLIKITDISNVVLYADKIIKN